jgi:hypothetical protein
MLPPGIAPRSEFASRLTGAVSFSEHEGAALIVVLRNDEEVAVTNRGPELIAALEELRVDPNGLFRLSKSRRNDSLVLWRAET